MVFWISTSILGARFRCRRPIDFGARRGVNNALTVDRGCHRLGDRPASAAPVPPQRPPPPNAFLTPVSSDYRGSGMPTIGGHGVGWLWCSTCPPTTCWSRTAPVGRSGRRGRAGRPPGHRRRTEPRGPHPADRVPRRPGHQEPAQGPPRGGFLLRHDAGAGRAPRRSARRRMLTPSATRPIPWRLRMSSCASARAALRSASCSRSSTGNIIARMASAHSRTAAGGPVMAAALSTRARSRPMSLPPSRSRTSSSGTSRRPPSVRAGRRPVFAGQLDRAAPDAGVASGVSDAEPRLLGFDDLVHQCWSGNQLPMVGTITTVGTIPVDGRTRRHLAIRDL